MNNMDPGLTVIHLGIRLSIGENRHFLAFEILKKNEIIRKYFMKYFTVKKTRHFYNSSYRPNIRPSPCIITQP